MGSLKGDDKLQTEIDRPYASDAVHAQAYAYLQRRHAEGTLPDIPGWPGNALEGYVDILGVRR